MQEQARRLETPLHWGRREKSAIAALVAVLIAAAIALGIHTAKTHNGREASDCIRVTFASTLGAADLHGCGPKARRICASGSFRNIQRELQQACSRAGFAYRPPH
jgi:hypothetical protein